MPATPEQLAEARKKAVLSPRHGKHGSPKKVIMRERAMMQVYEEWQEKLRAALPEVTASLVESAKGVRVQFTDKKTGKEIIFDKEPNISAIKEINDRLFGKAKETVKHEGTTPLGAILALIAARETRGGIPPGRYVEKIDAEIIEQGMEDGQSVLRDRPNREESTVPDESDPTEDVQGGAHTESYS